MDKQLTYDEAIERARNKLRLADWLMTAAKTMLPNDDLDFRLVAALAAQTLRSVMEPIVNHFGKSKTKRIHEYVVNRIPQWDVLRGIRDADYHEGAVSKHVSLFVSESVFGGPAPSARVEHWIAAGPNHPGLPFPKDFEKMAFDLRLLLNDLESAPATLAELNS